MIQLIAQALKSASHICGEMWFHNDSTSYTQSLTQSVPAIVACFSTTTNGQTLNGFTYASSALTCLNAGLYKVNWNASVGSSTSNHKHHFWLAINGAEQVNVENHCKPANSTDVIACSGSGFLTLSANDVVTLYVNDETGAETLTVYSANVNIIRV